MAPESELSSRSNVYILHRNSNEKLAAGPSLKSKSMNYESWTSESEPAIQKPASEFDHESRGVAGSSSLHGVPSSLPSSSVD